jgi:D-threonate/D-erythronate kinase
MIGVIADDLTGAAEIGAVGLRHGLKAEVIFGNESAGKADLVCMDTESRSLPALEASKRVAAAARKLRRAGAKFIFKKTDSVLRGPITAELDAVMKELGFMRTLLLPANPSLGRTIRDGKYFVKRRPINRTDFVRDPEHPRTSANVLRLLRPSAPFPVGVLRRSETIPAKGIFIGEVSKAAHIREWIARREADTLLAGGAETFGALLSATRRRITKQAPRSPGLSRELFVCGSASDSCRKFIARAKHLGIPVVPLPAELAWSSEFSAVATAAVAQQIIVMLETEPQIVLTIGLPQINERAIARRLTGHLAQLAARVLYAGNIDHVLAEGGETAAALVRQMRWTRLTVKRELSPGVATLESQGSERVLFTVKPGSYLWPDGILRPRSGRKFVAPRSGQRKRKSAK